MRNLLRTLPVLLSALLVAGPLAAPAGAAGRGTAQLKTQQARFGSGRLSRRAPSYRSRPTRPTGRALRRPSPFRGLFRGVLRALGLAYLFHLLFGWGAGGSPFGLLLLGALVLWLAMRRRPRRVVYR